MLEMGKMADLGQRGPLGQKKPKAEREKKKGLPRVSKKRAAYLSSPERKSGKIHMSCVAKLPCLVCGARPVEVHHEGKPRSDMNCLPLCPRHHRREYGVGAYHYSPKAFYTTHGPSEELLAKTMLILDK